MHLEITDLTHDGRGLARIGGKVAFVDGGLPGETVTAVLRRRHRRFDEYRLIDVVAASADRVTPACPLADTCGGCDLQHLAAEPEVLHKSRVVQELLARQARVVADEVAAPIRSAPFGYRRRARLAVAIPRRGGRPVLGFREAGGTRIVTVPHCPVLMPPLEPLPGLLQEIVAGMRRPRDLGHVELSLSESADGAAYPVIHLHAAAPLEERDLEPFKTLAGRRRCYLTVRVPDGPLVYVHRPEAAGPGYRLPDFDLRIGYEPGDFLQANPGVNRALVARVVDWLQASDAEHVLDAFAGIGNFTLPLARRGFHVHGLEVVPDMVARARETALAHGLGHARFDVRDLMHDAVALPDRRFDAAVLDPPRAGALALVRVLARQRIRAVLYVSCAPATFARDAAILAGSGYRLSRLGLVDMFPQTSHIEAVALFERR